MWEQTADSGCEVVMIQTRSAAEKSLLQVLDVTRLLYSREGNTKILGDVSVQSEQNFIFIQVQ